MSDNPFARILQASCNPFAAYAHRLLAAGYIPIPIEPGTKKPWVPAWSSYRLPDGQPHSKDDMYDVDQHQMTPAVIDEWIRRYPGAGVGVSCINIVVVDIDDAALVQPMLSLLQQTPCARRGRPERLSLIYRCDDPLSVTYPGLQILGAGRQCVLPPTMHPDTGAPFEWVGFSVPLWDIPRDQLPELPAIAWWQIEREMVRRGAPDPLLRLAATEARRRQGADLPPALAGDIAQRAGLYRAYATGALRAEASELAGLSGERNNQLFRAAASLSRFVSAGILTHDEVHDTLLQACISNGAIADNGERTFEASFESGLRTGAGDPVRELPNEALELMRATPAEMPAGTVAAPHTRLQDLWAVDPLHKFIYAPTGDLWPAETIDKKLPRVKIPGRHTSRVAPASSERSSRMLNDGMKPSEWLLKHQAVQQMVWVPGEQQIIENKLLCAGGWIDKAGDRVFNTYRPPTTRSGDAAGATRWLDHIKRVYPNDHDHIIAWMAHRAQRPGEKVNHALVLSGASGIGKDTMLRPLREAVGPWNWQEVSPRVVAQSQYNGYVESVVLRVNEARDLGDSGRFAFYEQMKTVEAAPPEVHSVSDKWIRAHPVLNVCGVVYTSNHKEGGMYLDADDRRHYVAWSEATKEEFDTLYWYALYDWMDREGGIYDCVAYLRKLDISQFDAKAPPKLTDAFWEMVEAGRPEEAIDVGAILDAIGTPDAVVLDQVRAVAGMDKRLAAVSEFLNDVKKIKVVAKAMADAGYVIVRNHGRDDGRGRWKINGRDTVIYGRKNLSMVQRVRSAEQLSQLLSANGAIKH